MNQHLTWDEISDYMIGGAAQSFAQPRYAQHARDCSQCKGEIAMLQGALADFRGAVHNWTDRLNGTRFETSVVHLDLRRSAYAGSAAAAGFGSLAVHAAIVALALFIGSLKPVQKVVKQVVTLVAPPPVPVKAAEKKGGGGGGARQPEVKKADLPKPAPRVFTPPRVDQVQTRLELPAALADAPAMSSTNVGDLTGTVAGLNGIGVGGGIGTGNRGGIGSGTGTGGGPGGGGTGMSGVYRAGGEVTNPVPLFMPEPQYSEEARKAKWGGTVLVSLVVDETGHPTDIKVVKPLGLGLDEKAVEAVAKWLFKPGLKSGKPVKVFAEVQVTFRLL